MKKRFSDKKGIESYLIGLILAAIVIIIVMAVIFKACERNPWEENFHPGSEMTLDRIKEKVDFLLESEKTTEIIRFGLQEDYVFFATDKHINPDTELLSINPLRTGETQVTPADAERKCGQKSCICITKPNKKSMCHEFDEDIIFTGKAYENPYDKGPLFGEPRTGTGEGYLALADIGAARLYMEKRTTAGKTRIYMTIIKEGNINNGITAEEIQLRTLY